MFALYEPSDLDSFQISGFKQDNKTPARHELVIVERVIKEIDRIPAAKSTGAGDYENVTHITLQLMCDHESGAARARRS